MNIQTNNKIVYKLMCISYTEDYILYGTVTKQHFKQIKNSTAFHFQI